MKPLKQSLSQLEERLCTNLALIIVFSKSVDDDTFFHALNKLLYALNISCIISLMLQVEITNYVN